MKILNILVGCEESQAVCIEFRKLGHNAFSCDTTPCSGGHPEWHIMGDLITAIELPNKFQTQDGVIHSVHKWDGLIAFPPCTFMSKAGAYRMYPQAGIIDKNRFEKAMAAKDFFLKLKNSDIDNISLENPTPLKIVGLPTHTQVIQPFHFGHPFSKRTLLWLKGFPELKHTNILTEYKPYLPSNVGGKKRGQSYQSGGATGSKQRSKTFPGIAKAMAEQWNSYLQNLSS